MTTHFQNPARPIIPWLGGKRRLARQLLPLFPEHSCYVELFCGGAALFFMREEPAKVEVLNDLNGDLVNLYRVVQNHLEEFVRQFKWAISSREVFKWQQETPPHTLTDIQRAARFYYLQHHAFGARANNPTFGCATTAPQINLLRIEETLSAAHLRLAGTTVERLPWVDCFKRYDRPHTFFYADPPYWQTAGYGMEFPWENYERLAGLMASCKGKVMLSINDHLDIRRLFAEFSISSLKIKYSVGNRSRLPTESTEIVITNYDQSRYAVRD